MLGTLRGAFPKIQFVATTHSPQVIASARPEWVRVLAGDSGPLRVEHVFGWDTNAVLKGIMGAEERPPETEQKLLDLFRHIDREHWSRARALHDVLAQDLGVDAPELVRARWMMEMDGAEMQADTAAEDSSPYGIP